MGCLCSDAIKLSLFIHRFPGYPNKPDHYFPRVYSQRRVRVCAGPVTFSLQDAMEADIPTIGPHGEAEVLRACNFFQDVQVFANAQLRVNPMVARSIYIPL